MIENGAGNAIVCVDIIAGGYKPIVFNPPLRFSPATALVVTLAAAGGAITGRLNVNTWLRL